MVKEVKFTQVCVGKLQDEKELTMFGVDRKGRVWMTKDPNMFTESDDWRELFLPIEPDAEAGE